MNSKTIMATFVVAVAMLGLFTILPMGDGVDEVDAVDVGDVSGLQNAFSTGGDYSLDSNITITGTLTLPANVDLELDLNGNAIIADSSSFTYDTSAVQKKAMIIINGDLTITDSSSDGSGIITSDLAANIIYITEGATVIINGGGVYRNVTSGENLIQNFGDLTIRGGIFTSEGADNTVAPTIVSTRPGGHTVINGGTYYTDVYAFNVMGNGKYATPEDLAYTTLTINDCLVSAEVGVGTNASSGKYSGFTITINGGDYITSTGVFASGYGIYNINGGNIVAEYAGVQVASGIVTIGENAMILTTGDNTDGYNSLAPGGSGVGDIAGALVVGKHSDGYIGNIEVNINGGVLASTEGTDAVVVVDKSMGEEALENNTISVKANGGQILGDVTFTSTNDTDEADKGESSKVSFELKGASVVGNMNKSDSFVGNANISSGTVSGDVAENITEAVEPGTVYFYDMGAMQKYYGSFTLPSTPSQEIEGYRFVGYSLSPNSTTVDYPAGATVSGLSGNVTVYEVWESETSYFPPIWDDDDDYVPPIVPSQTEDSGDDDTVTIVACAAAAVVAALLAAFLIIDRRQ